MEGGKESENGAEETDQWGGVGDGAQKSEILLKAWDFKLASFLSDFSEFSPRCIVFQQNSVKHPRNWAGCPSAFLDCLSKVFRF